MTERPRITPISTDQGNYLHVELPGLPGIQVHLTEDLAVELVADLCRALAEFDAPLETDLDSAETADRDLARTLAKRAAFEAAIATGRVVLVLLDARVVGVDLPKPWVRQSQVVLRYGLALQPPITDLQVDARGISATLAFGGVACATRVPWSAVRGLTYGGDGGPGIAWPEDGDLGVVGQVVGQAAEPPAEPARPRFGVIEGGLGRAGAIDEPEKIGKDEP